MTPQLSAQLPPRNYRNRSATIGATALQLSATVARPEAQLSATPVYRTGLTVAVAFSVACPNTEGSP
jgi:hypothetical protein